LRIDVLRQLAEPRSCTEVATELRQTPQKVYYHVKRLEEAGLVAQVAQRRVRGIHEGVYQATARSYWLSPGLVGPLGRRRATDQLSLGYLLDLVEQVQADVATLASRPTEAEVPSLAISGEVRLRPDDREAFRRDLQAALEKVLTKHGGAAGSPFKIAFACYPKD
jgi:predicted ArsR family transcriptional regulator